MNELEPVLRGGFSKGITDGVNDGEQVFRDFRDRVETEGLTVLVRGDWSEFDAQAKYREAGYVPETGAP
jgi:hypothetical protein